MCMYTHIANHNVYRKHRNKLDLQWQQKHIAPKVASHYGKMLSTIGDNGCWELATTNEFWTQLETIRLGTYHSKIMLTIIGDMIVDDFV